MLKLTSNIGNSNAESVSEIVHEITNHRDDSIGLVSNFFVEVVRVFSNILITFGCFLLNLLVTLFLIWFGLFKFLFTVRVRV